MRRRTEEVKIATKTITLSYNESNEQRIIDAMKNLYKIPTTTDNDGQTTNDFTDKELIISLSKLLDQTGLSEIEIENKKVGRVKVAKNILQSAPALTSSQSIQKSNSQDIETPGEDINTKNAVLSPMVGTVYLKPDPDSENFINEGDKVKKGQTILIIEAMKTMNNIASDKDGTVKKILVENEQPIQFDDPLILID